MQSQLDLKPAPVTVDVIRSRETMSDPIRLCIEVSHKAEQAIRMDLGIEAAQWTRIKQGGMHFPHDKLDLLMEIAGNDIPLEWLAWRRGKGTVLLEDEKDRRIRALQEELERAKSERETIAKFVREVRA